MIDTSKDLTEGEQQDVGRAMLAAALDALGEFPSDDAEEDQDETARRVILALIAASKAKQSERARLKELKGESPYINTDEHEAVATAFWMWSEHIELDVSEVSASSIAGSRLLGLAQGLAAARAMSEALDMLEDGSMFAFSSRGAVHLTPEAIRKGHACRTS